MAPPEPSPTIAPGQILRAPVTVVASSCPIVQTRQPGRVDGAVAVEFDRDRLDDRRRVAGDGLDLAAAVDRDRRVFVFGELRGPEAAFADDEQVAGADSDRPLPCRRRAAGSAPSRRAGSWSFSSSLSLEHMKQRSRFAHCTKESDMHACSLRTHDTTEKRIPASLNRSRTPVPSAVAGVRQPPRSGVAPLSASSRPASPSIFDVAR